MNEEYDEPATELAPIDQENLSLEYAAWLAGLKRDDPDKYALAVSLGCGQTLPEDYALYKGDPTTAIKLFSEEELIDEQVDASREVPEWCTVLLYLLSMPWPVLTAGMVLIDCSHPAAPDKRSMLARLNKSHQRATGQLKKFRAAAGDCVPCASDADSSDPEHRRERAATLEVLAWLVTRARPQLSILAMLRACGVAAGAEQTLQELAVYYGLTKQNVQREVIIAQRHFGLKRSRYQRTEEHAAIYKFTNCVNRA